MKTRPTRSFSAFVVRQLLVALNVLMLATTRSAAVASAVRVVPAYYSSLHSPSSAPPQRSPFLTGASAIRIGVAPRASAATGSARTFGSTGGAAGALRRTAPTMMPEGPEVRTLVDQLQPAVGMRLVDLRFLSGRYVRHGRPRGFDEFRGTMTPYGRRDGSRGDGGDGEQSPPPPPPADGAIDVVTEWNAKGKFIYMLLDDGNTAVGTAGDDYLRSIWITLGMSGRFVGESSEPAEQQARDGGGAGADDKNGPRWYLEFLDITTLRTRRIYYHDARNFGTLRFSLSEAELTQKLASLGPDILAETTTVDVFLDAMGRQRPDLNVCKFLMDQSKVCGIGNYILAEGLYRANVDPFAALSELSDDRRRSLFRELRATAQLSYASQGLTRKGGGTYRNVDGERGKFEFSLQCYGRERCARGRPVTRETKGPHGRAIWYVEDQLFVPRGMRGSDGRIAPSPPAPPVPTVPAASGGGGAAAAGSLADFLHDPGWKEAVSGALSSEKFSELSSFVLSERESGVTVYPPEEDVFSALNLCPLDDVRVVIVGQDPYHGPGQGHGLAFSVRKGVRPPPSLQNIFREAMDDVGISPPPHGFLECWAKQGILLLNSVLTVRRGEANSHARRGWEEFTDAIIDVLNERKEGLVFLLWGAPAAKKAAGVDETKHTIIKTSHPSPLGATKTSSPFLGSKCFSRANTALVEAGKDPVDWSVR